jgi:hypothetical protein
MSDIIAPARGRRFDRVGRAFDLAIASAATIVMGWNLDTMLPFDLASRSSVLPDQTDHRTDREGTLLKIFATVFLATAAYAGAANAHGGGPAETMPSTNFTDMPSYHPKPAECPKRVKCMGKHARWHRSSARDD